MTAAEANDWPGECEDAVDERECIDFLVAAIDGRVAAEKYIAAAFIVVFASVLIYLLIHSARVARLERDLETVQIPLSGANSDKVNTQRLE